MKSSPTRSVVVGGAALLSVCAACSSAPPPVATPPTSTAKTTVVAPPPTAAPTPDKPPVMPVEAPAPAHRNVIVITVDAMRADMPWNGYERPIAPNLTALANKSVVYSRAYALSSYTAMSMGGFLGGRYPGELKRSGYFFSGYPEEETLFPEVLQKRGVQTVAAHAHFYFDKESGFRQGFDTYEMVPGIIRDAKTDNSITSPEHVDLAMKTLGAVNAKKPFFAWYHFMDPHDKYRKHEGFKQFGPRNRDRYDGEIFFTDHHLGRLLSFIEEQSWADHTAIIVSADHGEAFGEKKMTRHGFELWDHLVHVPLIVYVPGNEPRRIDELRSHIDLAPTIFDLLKQPSPDFFVGQSRLAEVLGKEAPPEGEVIVDLPRTSHNWRRRALVKGPYKLIAFGDDFRYELYNIVEDPTEQRDLRGTKRDVYDSMKARYLELVKGIKDVCPKMRHKLKGKRKEAEC